MSIRINKTIVLKVCKEEYDLLLFMREKMLNGRCTLIIHSGRPIRLEDVRKSEILGTKELTKVDFTDKVK